MVFFDVRNDSNALYHLYQIRLAGVYDLQLMERATQRFAKTYVNGLSKCLENDLDMLAGESFAWKATKKKE